MNTRALVLAAIIAPWLALVPVGGAPGLLAHAVAIIAAFHGAGVIVARLAGQTAIRPALAVQWGVAALIGLSGVATALQIGGLGVHSILVFGCAAVHSVALGMRFDAYVERAARWRARSPLWLVPTVALLALGALAVLGAAAAPLAQPFDDEAHLAAQLRRLLDTGMLGDPIGYPRLRQLGGQLALNALAAGADDAAARIVEPIAQLLALGLAIASLGARDANAALWALLVVIAGHGVAFAPIDPLPCWTAVGLMVALYTMLGEHQPPPLAIGLTAGALCAIRLELAPVAAVAVVATWWRARRDHRATLRLLAGLAFVVAPFVLSRTIAWHGVPAAIRAAVDAPGASLPLRAVAAAAIAAIATGVLRLTSPGSRAIVIPAVATGCALGADLARLTGGGAYSLRMLWPIAFAFAIAVVIALARARSLGPAAWIAALVLVVLTHEGIDAPGRLKWSRRAAAAASDIDTVQRPAVTATGRYAELLTRVPNDATVAVWVHEPEHLDYWRVRIVDLRTPAVARLRRHDWRPRDPRLASLIAATNASFLLFEADDAGVRRTQTDLLYRLLCATPRPICDDDLEAIVHGGAVVARRDNLLLVALRARAPNR